MEFLAGRVEVIEGDITLLELDAIVNAANKTLLGGGGVDGAIHRAAGPRLLEETRTLGGARTGEAKITKGYRLPAKSVIHTVGPVWHGGGHDEERLLADCYRNSLKVAVENGCRSIAFPAVSTGVYHFPLERATEIALSEIKVFLSEDDALQKVVCCCFGRRDYDVYVEQASRIFA